MLQKKSNSYHNASVNQTGSEYCDKKLEEKDDMLLKIPSNKKLKRRIKR